jgi:hypothetical protein
VKNVIRVGLDGQMLDRFKVVKKYYGLKRNTEVIRTLIAEKYGKLEQEKTKKVLIPTSLYNDFAEIARRHNLDVDQYMQKITVKMLEEAKANSERFS